MLSECEQIRYSRQINLPAVGNDGQLRIKSGRVLIVGSGGLGNPAALYLAAAGVGHLVLIDDDRVEMSNLQRQIAFETSELGVFKSEALARRCRAINPDISVTAITSRFDRKNARELLEQVSICVDASDNLEARYLLNDLCVGLGKPWVYASVYRFEGQLALFRPLGACYRCLFPEPPTSSLNCTTAGVLGVLPGTMATLQANLVLQYLLEPNRVWMDELTLFDGRHLQLTKFALTKEPECVICRKTSAEILQTIQEASRLCHSVQEITVRDLVQKITGGGVTLVDIREDNERGKDSFIHPSIHIPYSRWYERWTELSSCGEVILYCASGQRSYSAASFLVKRRLPGISLKGGYQAWLEDMRQNG